MRAFDSTATFPRACAGVVPWTDENPEKAITPISVTVLAVAADPENVCNASRSNPERDPGSQGAHGGGPLGSFAIFGISPSTPAVRTDPPSHQVTRYGADARSDRVTRAGACAAAALTRRTSTVNGAVNRRIRGLVGNGRPSTYVQSAARARRHASRGALPFLGPPP